MLLTIQVDEKFHWSFESGREPADFWQSFHEGVNRITDQPRCICKRCGVQFNHPKVKGSPASLSKHAKESCKKSIQYGSVDIFSTTSSKDSTEITRTQSPNSSSSFLYLAIYLFSRVKTNIFNISSN